ncbi:hypothetical protein TWF730_006214 [Orbilia blumenaviensis]|uniref:Uncharacterized protein n=1 Tax=Orbilia blumenaviensis TaxID=1796055 RepID=A0AAV9VDL3_9PEZI
MGKITAKQAPPLTLPASTTGEIGGHVRCNYFWKEPVFRSANTEKLSQRAAETCEERIDKIWIMLWQKRRIAVNGVTNHQAAIIYHKGPAYTGSSADG